MSYITCKILYELLCTVKLFISSYRKTMLNLSLVWQAGSVTLYKFVTPKVV